MRILLTGHVCAPDAGSEPGITWNWAAELAKHNDVWVITHEHYRPSIERYLIANPLPRLRFVYTGRLGWWDPLRLPSVRGIRLHYMAWRRRALRIARELDGEHDFDIVHHVSWNTVSAPPLVWQLGKPFVWGPVGGGQTTPTSLLGCFGARAPAEILRTVRVWLMPFLPSVRRTAANAAAVFAANRETLAVLRRAGAHAVPQLMDVGVPRHLLDHPLEARPDHGPFVVLWAGRIEPRKGFGLCLRTAALIRRPEVKVLVVGDGPDASAARRQARRMGLDGRVEFLGPLPWQRVQALQRSAHAFLFTSIRDTSGTAALEALAGGTPVICIDHQGMGTHLPAEVAIKVPVSGPRATAEAMAHAIEALAQDRSRLAEMSRAARRYIEHEAWDRRAAAMQAQYEAILSRSQRSRNGMREAAQDTGCGLLSAPHA